MAFVAGERSFSPSFQQCIAKHQDQHQSSPTEENPTGLLGAIKAYVVCSGEFIDAINGTITALATIVIATFTATLWRATTRQSELTREALIADKQAFIFSDGFNGLWELDATGHYSWRFRPVWKNSGDTPTRNLRFRTNCELRNTPMTVDYSFSTNDAPGTGLIGPKSSALGGLSPYPEAPISAQDLVDVQAGRKYLYLWGWARYYDVFPDTPEHITHFCWVVLPNGDPMTYQPNSTDFRFDHVLFHTGNFTRDG
jgi:hypothetical protein